MLSSVKSEHDKVTSELKQILQEKTEQLNETKKELVSSKTSYMSEKAELQHTLTNDKYTTDLNQRENESLRQAKADWDKERVDLVHKIDSLEKEADSVYTQNKALRTKVKKLETVLYGRKWLINTIIVFIYYDGIFANS